MTYADRIIAESEAYETSLDARIRALLTEAAEHGDLDMVETCEQALAGDYRARARCERTLSDAEVMS